MPCTVAKAKTSREMLEAVLVAGRQATKDNTERARQADKYGDKGLMVQLEDMVRDGFAQKLWSESIRSCADRNTIP